MTMVNGFSRECTLIWETMWFLYRIDDVGYEEFLAAVYEAETEGSEGKVVNAKAKVFTVEKIVENRELNKLIDLRQQIESLTSIMKLQQ